MSVKSDIAAPAGARLTRLRGGQARSLESALCLLLLSAVLLGLLQLALGLANRDVLWAIAMFTAVFWIWVGAGVIAWWRRPNNAIGSLIVVGGFAAFAGGLANLNLDVLTVVSAVFATAVLAVAVHVLHAFPSGRLRGAASISTVIAGYVVAIGMSALMVALLFGGYPQAAEIVAMTQRALGLAVMTVTAVLLTSRLISTDVSHRRVLGPLFVYSIAALLLIPLAPNVLGPLGVNSDVIAFIQLSLSAGLPLAFLLGVLMGGYARTGALDALTAWLGVGSATRSAVARALADTLGDSSLEIVYFSPERSAYLDDRGEEIDPSESPAHRAWFDVRVDGRRVGAIVYDARLIGDPYPVRRASEVLAMAIDRERLSVELHASHEALLQSRVRLVETADRERSRIAQDLHDGLQVQLVILGLEAQRIAECDAPEAVGAAATRLRHGIDDAAADLRRLVHNVLPTALVQQGLTVAVEDLVDRLTIPATFEADISDDELAFGITNTAYFIAAEALTNAVKHSRARHVSIHLHRRNGRLVIRIDDDGIGGASADRGTGLRGLLDRVDVAGGTVAITSGTGQGTQIKAELPCG